MGIDTNLPGDGERAVDEDQAAITEVTLNEPSQKLVSAAIAKHGLPVKEVKTYELVYFS